MSYEKIGSGKTLKGQSREIVYNVFKYFMAKKNNDGKRRLYILYALTSEATGVSKRSVQRVVYDVRNQVKASTSQSSKGESSASNPMFPVQISFKTPGKKRPRIATKSTVNGFDQEIIRRTIYNLILVQHEHPTYKMLWEVLKDMINFKGGVSSLRKVVRRLGFRPKRTHNNKNLLIEKSQIRIQRTLYLSKLQEYRSEDRPIIYLDESYIHSSPRSWSDETCEDNEVRTSKKSMLVIVHACSEQGFIPEALLINPSKKPMGDFQNYLSADIYHKWIREKLIPNLPPQSVVVVSNSSYHNIALDVVPEADSTKSEMLIWLEKNNISYPEINTKPVLYDIIKKNKRNCTQFVLDKILEDHGHSVLRLPPFHPELNPIELLLSIIKDKIASQSDKLTSTNVEELYQKEAECITLDMFQEIWKKTQENEEEYIQLEPEIDNFTDSLILLQGNSDSESSGSSSDENMSDVEISIYESD